MERNIYKIGKELFITSDEEIKDGDWFIYRCYKLCKCTGLSQAKQILVNNEIAKHEYYGKPQGLSKKIILTDNKDLIKDGVQTIDDEFLNWFVKNPSCEEVAVETVFGKKWKDYEYYREWHKNKVPDWAWDYKIFIPKVEPEQEFCDNCNNDICCCIVKKQETFEIKRNYQKHSLTKTKGYKLWCNIIQRCYNPKNHSYKYYGGKGVIMEDYFKNSYENFIDWIKGIANYEKWLNSSELSLDRIDNTLGYIRGNIKFSTKTEQVENQNLRIDNKSGYKGVCYHKLNKKYGATITINKSKVFLGYYNTALEAALIYDNYVLKNNLNRKTNL